MNSKTNKKDAPPARSAPKTNTRNDTTGRPEKTIPEQMNLPGIPPPTYERDTGPLADWLEDHPGWWGQQFLCGTLGMDPRTLRLQSQHGDGRVIFSSSGGGLSATIHSDEIEVDSCVAEMVGRIRAMAKRIHETRQRAKLAKAGRP